MELQSQHPIRRAFARFADFSLYESVLFFIFALYISSAAGAGTENAAGILFLSPIFIYPLFDVIFILLFGSTPGKVLLGIKVVDLVHSGVRRAIRQYVHSVFYIPILCHVAWIVQWVRVSDGLPVTYDKTGTIEFKKLTLPRALLTSLIITSALAGIVLTSKKCEKLFIVTSPITPYWAQIVQQQDLNWKVSHIYSRVYGGEVKVFNGDVLNTAYTSRENIQKAGYVLNKFNPYNAQALESTESWWVAPGKLGQKEMNVFLINPDQLPLKAITIMVWNSDCEKPNEASFITSAIVSFSGNESIPQNQSALIKIKDELMTSAIKPGSGNCLLISDAAY